MKAGYVQDPVCGMWVDPTRARAATSHAGQMYSFCDPGCREAFLADPDRYTGLGTGGGPASSTAVTLHRTDGAETRSCPGCGSQVSAARTDQERIGGLFADEFVTVVRARWRRRLGRRSYRREHSAQLIRALAAHALEPESPIRTVVVDDELTLEVARLRAEGLSRAQMRRELYHLARVTGEILAGSGLDPARAAPMIEAIDRRLTMAMPPVDRAIAWSAPPLPS